MSTETPTLDGSSGFDFEFGNWSVHHRVKNASTGGEWKEFEGVSTCRPLMDGSGNIEEHTFFRTDVNTYGLALRAFDKQTGLWAIWWVDSRDPHLKLDPPMKGRFENGVGTFYADDIIGSQPTRVRFIWSHTPPHAAHWEQAFSADGGETWDTNWVMEFERVS